MKYSERAAKFCQVSELKRSAYSNLSAAFLATANCALRLFNLELPKSFEIDISKGKMWVHGNATKHMFQEIAQNWKGKNPMKISNQTLYTQFVLYDFYQNLNSATAKGIKYGTIQTVGNWEFIFSHPRIEGGLPVVKHAQFLGWNHKEDKYD